MQLHLNNNEKSPRRRGLVPRGAAFVASVAALALLRTATAAAQVCNAEADVEGIIFSLGNTGADVDTFRGGAAQAAQRFVGYLTPKNPDPATTPLVALQMLNESGESPTSARNWTTTAFQIIDLGGGSIVDLKGVNFNDQQVPPGGLGRYRAIAVWWNECQQRHILKTMDAGGPPIGTQEDGLVIRSGILSDTDPKPSNSPQRQYLGLGRAKFAPNVPANETRTYYNSVGTNADGSGPSITSRLGNLQEFRNRYFSAGKELLASYYNKGDLGIGREMHCNFGASERACYVANFAPCAVAKQANGLCRKPIFNDRAGAFAEQLGKKVPFATVAMVERNSIRPDQPNSTFFAVFVCDSGDCSALSNHRLYDGPVALDNHGVAGQGSNTFNPGNCMSCHGTGGQYDTQRHATIGAYFLPFDMDAFDYLSTDRNSPLSRIKVHDTMREMNLHIAASHLGKLGNAKKMIDAWYGNSATGTFVGHRLPSGLGFTPNQSSERVYLDVYGKACRGCHITSSALQFSTWAQWQSLGALMKTQLCDARIMPLAERTQDLVWDGMVRRNFFHHLGFTNAVCNPQ